MPQIITPPHLKLKRHAMRVELALLEAKEKLLGKLSEAEKKRRDEIMRQLAIRF